MKTEPEEKRNHKPVIIIVVALICVFALVIPILVIPSVKYNNASKMLQSGNYDTAREAFIEIENFKDSRTMASECLYQKAAYLMNSREWDASREIFLSLTGYKDSDVQALECLYQKAEDLFNKKEWDRSRELYILLSDYQDSKEKANECLFQKATALRDNKEWDASIAVLEEIKAYGNANELILENQYDHAKEDLESKNYINALKRFHDLGYYKDSRKYWDGVDIIYDKCIKDDPKNGKVTVVCEYNDNDKPTKISYSTDSSEQTELREYDEENRCLSYANYITVPIWGIIQYYTEEVKYNENGKIGTQTNNENGSQVTMDYHYSENRLDEVIYTYSDDSKMICSYYYDQDGNVIKEERRIENEENPYYILTNEYDEKGNKILMVEENIESGLKSSETYKYDDLGFLSELTNTDTTGLTKKYIYKRNSIGTVTSYSMEDTDGYSEECEYSFDENYCIASTHVKTSNHEEYEIIQTYENPRFCFHYPEELK